MQCIFALLWAVQRGGEGRCTSRPFELNYLTDAPGYLDAVLLNISPKYSKGRVTKKNKKDTKWWTQDTWSPWSPVAFPWGNPCKSDTFRCSTMSLQTIPSSLTLLFPFYIRHFDMLSFVFPSDWDISKWSTWIARGALHYRMFQCCVRQHWRKRKCPSARWTFLSRKTAMVETYVVFP